MPMAVEKIEEKTLAVAATGPVLGIEGVDDTDMKVGNVVLVQDGTKVFRKMGLNPGEFVNGVTGKKIVDLSFTPAYMTKWYEVYDQTGASPKWLFRTKNENDAKLQGKSRRPAGPLKAEVVPVLFVVAVMEGKPVKIGFKNISGYPAGQKLYTYAREAKKALWENEYVLSSREAKNKSGQEYFCIEVAPKGASSIDAMAMAQRLYQSFKATELAMDGDAQEGVPDL